MNMQKVLSTKDLLIIEQRKNAALTYKLKKAEATIEYMAMMQDTELPTEEVVDVKGERND